MENVEGKKDDLLTRFLLNDAGGVTLGESCFINCCLFLTAPVLLALIVGVLCMCVSLCVQGQTI